MSWVTWSQRKLIYYRFGRHAIGISNILLDFSEIMHSDLSQIVRGLHVMDMENLVEKLLVLLKKKGYTQRGFEYAAGLSENRISKWKAGQGEASLLEAVRMAKLLEVSLDYLAGVEDRGDRMSELTRDERLVIEMARKLGMDKAQKRLLQDEDLQESGYTHGRGGSVRMRPTKDTDAGSDDEATVSKSPNAPGRVV